MNDYDRKLREQSLNALLLEGVNSGDPIPVETRAFALACYHLSMASNRQNKIGNAGF